MSTKLLQKYLASAALLLGVFATESALAAPITFSATGTGGRNASASFDIVGGQLSVSLSNNAIGGSGMGGVWQPIDILTGLFFNVTSGSGGLSAVDAHAQSAVSQFSTSGTETGIYGAGRDIGSEWAAKSGAITAGVNFGFSGAGLGGTFGTGNIIGNDADGADIEGIGGAAPDGLAYGIIGGASANYTSNGGVADRSLVKGIVTFLVNLPVGFDINDINYVVFNYGTALGEGGFTCSNNCIPPFTPPTTPPNIPEPSALASLGLGLIVMAAARRRRKQS